MAAAKRSAAWAAEPPFGGAAGRGRCVRGSQVPVRRALRERFLHRDDADEIPSLMRPLARASHRIERAARAREITASEIRLAARVLQRPRRVRRRQLAQLREDVVEDVRVLRPNRHVDEPAQRPPDVTIVRRDHALLDDLFVVTRRREVLVVLEVRLGEQERRVGIRGFGHLTATM